MTEREIFFEALEMGTPEARAAYLKGACGSDVTLRRGVDALLREHFSNDDLLAGPALEPLSPASPEAGDSQPLAQMIGRYKLLEKIGEGGFGEVWMAEQREPVKRRVALKIIKLGMDSRQIVARFEAERQALAMMDHPNIAKIFDAGTTDVGRPFFVMELVRGIRITEYCDQAQLPMRERLLLFILACQAIQHAHQKGIIHRDIKPSNILVTLHDGVPVPKVIDFGIAKATQGELTDKTVFTQFQQFIGTPAYISPEQAEMSGLDIDTRADIYSLGVLLYELLVGQTPFDAREMMASGLDALRKTIREVEPVRPSTKLSQTLVAAEVTKRTLGGSEDSSSSRRRLQEQIHQIQGDLDWIVMKCLEKDRARRYETANGLAADLQRHLANEPVIARPPSAAYQFQKAWQRNKLVFSTALAVVLALVVGIGISLWQTIRANEAKTVAIQARTEAESSQRKAEAERQRADASQRYSRRLQYSSDMNLTQQALKLNNVGNALRLLERNRPQPGEEDLRGWEWRYLSQLTRSSALVTLTNRPMRGSSVSFSPDGKRLAAGWDGGRVELWDVPERRRVRVLAAGEQPHQMGRVAFSPVRNLLAATSSPDAVTLYDLDSGQESVLWRVPNPGLWDIRDLSFSPDGSRVVIYAGSMEEFGDAVWVGTISSSKIDGPYRTAWSNSELHGAARLSPDNRRLYLSHSDPINSTYGIRCLDLQTGEKLWQNDSGRDYGLTTLALSPDGQTLASGSGFDDSTICIWDAATGNPLKPLDGHTGWVCKLAFTRDGRRLISAASDQTIRVWDSGTWTAVKEPMRGHTDEVYAVALSEPAQLIASAGKDGNLMLWSGDGKSTADGYRRLPKELRTEEVLPLDRSRVLLLPPDRQTEWIELQRDSAPVLVPELGLSTNVLGVFDSNIVCHRNGSGQIVVHEWRRTGFVKQGSASLDSGRRPTGFAYTAARRLLAWTDGTSSPSVFLASLATPSRRTELKSDVGPLELFRFSEDGNHLAATAEHDHSLRAWNVETGRVVVSLNERVRAVAFAAGGRVLVTAIEHGNDHEVGFFDLTQPGRQPRRVHGKGQATSLAVSPDGSRVASATAAGEVRLFDPLTAKLLESVRGHLNGASSVAFSPDGRRLISTSGSKEAVKLWQIGPLQELLTLGGTGSMLEGRWSADGDTILAGAPWQAWRAPSWEEIAAAEAQDKAERPKP